MDVKFIVLWTDALLYTLVICVVAFIIWARKKVPFRNAWRQVMQNRLAVVSLFILSAYFLIAILDSIHFQKAIENSSEKTNNHYSTNLISVLDLIVSPLGENLEKTYSAPFAN